MKRETEHKTIAIFDFDGTITTKDTLFDFTKFYHGKLKYICGVFLLFPILVSHKLGLISAEKAKKIFISFFFKGQDRDIFNQICDEYESRINKILNSDAIDKIKWHQQQGHLTIINSASLENWIQPWAESQNIETVIATRIEIVNNLITGKFIGKNCNGIEKVRRFRETFPNTDNYTIYVYGDSSGDKELLSIADYPFFRKF